MSLHTATGTCSAVAVPEPEPEISDIESDGFPSDISCNDYSDYLNDDSDVGDVGDDDIEIDMDSSPVNNTARKPTIPPKTKTIEPMKSTITKKPIVKKESAPSKDSSKDSCKETKSQPLKKAKEVKDAKDAKEAKDNRNENKTLAADNKFQFNEETIEYFCKDILGDVNKICVANSTFKNDTALLCLLLKLQVFKEYKCSEKKCKTGKTWLGAPIQLLIHRKNGKMYDLTTTNLELICPNCYISKYGLDLFIKVIAKTIYKCSYCEYPLSNFTNSKKKERICMSCEAKIMTSGYFEQRSKFIDQLSDTIDEASTLKKDEFKSSNYYNQVSQYKSFNSTDEGGIKAARKTTSESSKKTFNDKPIITLNLTVPNIDDLISED